MSISNLLKSEDASYLDLKVNSIESKSTIMPLAQESILTTDSSGIIVQSPYAIGSWSTLVAGTGGISAITVSYTQYQLIDNVVYCRLAGNVQTTAPAVGTASIQLPIAKTANFVQRGELSGCGSKYNIGAGTSSLITMYGNIGSSSVATLYIESVNILLDDFQVSFSYSLN